MVRHPRLEPLTVPLDEEDHHTPLLGEELVCLLVLFVDLVDGAVHVSVSELTGLPVLELIVQRLQHLAPEAIVVGVNEGLFPLPFGGRLATLLAAHSLNPPTG